MEMGLVRTHEVNLIPSFCVRLADVQGPGGASHTFGRARKSQIQRALPKRNNCRELTSADHMPWYFMREWTIVGVEGGEKGGKERPHLQSVERLRPALP